MSQQSHTRQIELYLAQLTEQLLFLCVFQKGIAREIRAQDARSASKSTAKPLLEPRSHPLLSETATTYTSTYP